MNVLITNKLENVLSKLNVEIIKTLRGEFDAEEIIGTFSNFFFGKMILDLTAIKDFENITNIQKISIGLPVEKIIIVLPPNGNYSSNSYLSKLISMGFYNFTTNVEGVEYLINNPNSYKDVAHLHQLEPQVVISPPSSLGGTTNYSVIQNNDSGNINSMELPTSNIRIIGFKNVTDHAGATTLVVTMKKELQTFHGIDVKAIEVGKRDFVYFNDKDLISTNKNDFLSSISKSSNCDLILVDLNDMEESSCSEVYYLIEPSIIQVNKAIRRDKNVFTKLKDKRVIINKSMISNEDISEFAAEAGIKVFTAIRPFNDRSKSQVLTNLLNRLGIIHIDTSSSEKKSSGFGGIFRH